MDATQNSPAVAAQDFKTDFLAGWAQIPNKGLFLSLLAAWFLLFHFLGNSTLGYIHTPSLIGWMYDTYNHSDGGDEHGNLIPVVVLALFWWKRKELLALSTRIWWPGLVLLGLALVLHVLGYLVQQPRISIAAFFAGIYALMGVVWGPRWLRASFFPFFLFVFCIPISSITDSVTLPLRILVSKIVAVISLILGLDVIREGTQLFNSQHTYGYDVAAACSGLRSLVAILALAIVYGFVNFEKTWKRLLIIASALPLAILSNVVRMMGIILAAELFGQSAGNEVHDNWFFSLLPYVPAIIGLLALGHWLKRPKPGLPASLKPKPA
jgi:exosortase